MKSLNKYITEKLVVNKEYKTHSSKPTDFNELRQVVLNRFKEEGPGTEKEPISFNDIDVSNIKTFHNSDIGVFGYSDYEYIDISGWDTSNVTDMKYMFNRSEKLKSVNGLDKIDTSNVENMEGMFTNCKSLENVPKFDTSNVTDMQKMFIACKSLDNQTRRIWNLDELGTPQI